MYSFSTCNSPFVETNKGRTSLNSLPVLFPISRRTGVNASKTAKTGDVPADWMVHLPITSATMRSMDSEHFPIPGNGFPQNPLPDKSFTRFFSKNRRGPGGSAPGRPAHGAKYPLAAASETPAPRTARIPSRLKRHPQMAQSPGAAEGRRPHPNAGGGRRPFVYPHRRARHP